MKNKFLKYIAVFFTVLAVFSTSCEKWIDPEVNIDPDSPIDVALSSLLPSVQARLAYNLGGMDVVGLSGMWTQHVAGSARQAGAINRYSYTEADCNNLWNSMFAGSMMDIKIMMDKAGDESPHYMGVAQILMAMSLGYSTSLWGDIPYTESFQGDANLKPVLDSQQSIYATIDALLASAITNLQKPAGENLFKLSSDFIYTQSTAAWLKAAYSLRARYELHKSKKGLTDWNNILTYVGSGFASNADNFAFLFGASETSANPLYQFTRQRGDIGMNTGFQTKIATDPRKSVFTQVKVPGTTTNNNFGSYYGSISSPVVFMSFAELKFIEAEAHLRKASPAPAMAAAAYNQALEASLAQFEVMDATWLTANSLDENTISIQAIMEAKYIALFLNFEAYNDIRRTGYPVLTPVGGASTIPFRLPYPTSERLYNGSNLPTGITIFSKLWVHAD